VDGFQYQIGDQIRRWSVDVMRDYGYANVGYDAMADLWWATTLFTGRWFATPLFDHGSKWGAQAFFVQMTWSVERHDLDKTAKVVFYEYSNPINTRFTFINTAISAA
jgi:hypothetical protein